MIAVRITWRELGSERASSPVYMILSREARTSSTNSSSTQSVVIATVTTQRPSTRSDDELIGEAELESYPGYIKQVQIGILSKSFFLT